MIIAKREVNYKIKDKEAFVFFDKLNSYYLKLKNKKEEFLICVEPQVIKNKKLFYRIKNNLDKNDNNFVIKFKKLAKENEIIINKNLVEEIENMISYYNEQFTENKLIKINNNHLIKNIKGLNYSLFSYSEGIYNKVKGGKKLKKSDYKSIYNLYQRIFYKVSPFSDFVLTTIYKKNEINKIKMKIEPNLKILKKIYDMYIIENIENTKLILNGSEFLENDIYKVNSFVDREKSSLYRTKQSTLKLGLEMSKIIHYIKLNYGNKYFKLSKDAYLLENSNIILKFFNLGIIICKENKDTVLEILNILKENKKIEFEINKIIKITNSNFIWKNIIILKKCMIDITKKLNFTNVEKNYYYITYYKISNKQENKIFLNKEFKDLLDIFNFDLVMHKLYYETLNENELLVNSPQKFYDFVKRIDEISITLNSEKNNKWIKTFEENKNKIIKEFLKNDVVSINNKILMECIKIHKKHFCSSENYDIFIQKEQKNIIFNQALSANGKFLNRFYKYEKSKKNKYFDSNTNFGFNVDERKFENTVWVPNGENRTSNVSIYNLQIVKENNRLKIKDKMGNYITVKTQNSLIHFAMSKNSRILETLSFNSGVKNFISHYLIINELEKYSTTNMITINRKYFDNIIVHRKTIIIKDNPFYNKQWSVGIHLEIYNYFKKNKIPVEFFLITKEINVFNLTKPKYCNIKLIEAVNTILENKILIIQEVLPTIPEEYIYEI